MHFVQRFLKNTGFGGLAALCALIALLALSVIFQKAITLNSYINALGLFAIGATLAATSPKIREVFLWACAASWVLQAMLFFQAYQQSGKIPHLLIERATLVVLFTILVLFARLQTSRVMKAET